MWAQALHQSVPVFVSTFNTNSLIVILKTPSCNTSNKHHYKVLATATAPKREKDARKRVVITGMGLVSVFGNNVDTYYERLLAGESGISLIDRFDTSMLNTKIGGQIRGFKSDGYIDDKNDEKLHDGQRYCIVAGKKALEDAGINAHELSKFDKARAGVLVGTNMGGSEIFTNNLESFIKKGCNSVSPYLIPLMSANMPSALLAMDLGFMGPNYCINATCATSNVCINAASNYIREGKADLILAGGVESSVVSVMIHGFSACRALSHRNDNPHTACRPWDKDRDGFVIGEGCGVLVMESLDQAMKRDAPILAEYLGGAINSDAYHVTTPRFNGSGGASCIQKSLVVAGVSADEVNYINAHATSTQIGDLSEVNALKKVFKNTAGLKMNATKSMIGHCLGAAGGLEAIATIKAIQTGWLHPTINQFNVEPEVEIDTVANIKQQHEINVAISNSLGIGGHNSAIVLSPFKP